MDNLIEAIETAAIPDKAAQARVRFDWRAAQMLGGLHDARMRQGGVESNATTNQTVIIGQIGGDDALKRILDTVYAAPKSKEIVDVESVKKISEKSHNDAQ